MGAQDVFSTPRSAKKDCVFARLCQRFIVWLKLPDAYFDKTYDLCCCTSCFVADSHESASHFLRGKPPKQYGPPIGWFRCGLHVPPRAKACKAFDNYHRAYHGTTVDVVGGNILNEGSLLLPGCKQSTGFRLDLASSLKAVNVFVESWAYMAGVKFSKADRITVDGKAYTAQVVFQVLVEPGSYTVGKQTVGATSQLDPRFSNEELEWSTKQRGAIILYGLLCRLQPC